MSTIVVIDFGSQVTQLIARRIRELGVYSEVFSANVDLRSAIDLEKIDAVILSGGPDSVASLSEIPAVLFDIMKLNKDAGIPVLGICYGMQLLARYFNITVESGSAREFGKAQLRILNSSEITRGIWDTGKIVDVWMSHSDSVVGDMPDGFKIVACSEDTEAVALFCNDAMKIYGMQFHPEVSHTSEGKELLDNFLSIAGCVRNWTMGSFMETKVSEIRDSVGGESVVAAISGGVDSTVASILLHRAIGDRLKCIFVNTGCLRKGEEDEVRNLFVKKLDIPVTFVDASNLFLGRLRGVVDPEKKREVIGNTFIEVFEKEAKKVGDAKFLMQGTIYPDVIESGGGGVGERIKSHHNVGGLPEIMNLLLVEPLRCLFKDEVRLLGKELGIPSVLLNRHPFPGPGLAVRIVGEVTEDKLALLREVDSIYIDMLRESGFYDDIWQAFAVLLPVKTVGVMGDGRTYSDVCCLRAVTSRDGMTANCYPFGEEEDKQLRFIAFLQKVGGSIIRNLPGVNRIMYDITSKPPATIEWE